MVIIVMVVLSACLLVLQGFNLDLIPVLAYVICFLLFQILIKFIFFIYFFVLKYLFF